MCIRDRYREPPDAPDFTLFDQNGDPFTLSEHEGNVVVVAFVYTSCPDICLVISANLDYIGQNLAGYSDDVVIVSVTIDPARDTVSHLAEWTEQMRYDWYHLTGSTATLEYIGQNLAGYSDDVVIVSVTIDPARDTVSHLAEWTEQMSYDWYLSLIHI